MSHPERHGAIVPIVSNRRQVSDSSGTDQPPQPPRPVRPHTPPPQDNYRGTNGNRSHEFTLQSLLPSAWAVTKNDAHVRPFNNPLRISGLGEKSHVLVVANRPICVEILQPLALSRNTTRSDPVHVYYFEVSIKSGVTWIGLVPRGQMQNKYVTPNRFPGDCPGSIGMASDGSLVVSGRQVEPTGHMEYHSGDRETIGCGLVISNIPKVFFTRNGEIWSEPMEIPEVDAYKEYYFPSVAVAPKGDVFANFGLDRRFPFRWKGSSRYLLLSSPDIVQGTSSLRNSPARVPPSPGNSPTKVPQIPVNSPTRVPSTRLDWFAHNRDEPWIDGPPCMGTLSVGSHRATIASLPSRPPTESLNIGPRNVSHESPPGPVLSSLYDQRVTTIYGRPSDKSALLEGDLPGPTSPELPSPAFYIHDSPKQGPFLPSSPSDSAPISPKRQQFQLSSDSSNTSDTKPPAQASSPYPSATLTPEFPAHPSHPLPEASAFYARSGVSQSTHSSEQTRPGVVWVKNSSTLMDTQEVEETAACAHDLRICCMDENADESFLEGLLETCRSKQIQVRKMLEEGQMKFDDPSLEGTIHELVTVNESLLDSIKIAEKKFEGETKPAPLPVPPVPEPFHPEPRPDIGPGITRSLEIDVLVQTRDIFSLICMLRAQGDKRLESALALMRFARDAENSSSTEAEQLRYKIRSFGGLDSLLALFRRKGASRELKVAAALAVAYLLPSFESNSLQSPSLGLKIVECLRFLVASEPATPEGEELSRAEMRTASAMGVYKLWIFCISPLLRDNIAPARSFNEAPELTRGISSRLRRRNVTLSRAGGNVFDQRQEVLELQELLELTVSLIVEMAKTTDLADTFIQTLVPPICSIDLARPIAVREGVLKVLVSWMKSQNRKKILCAARSVNELTSTGDRYMAGWIHSQIVNEGALVEIVNISTCRSAGHGFQLAVAEILCRLCEAPHTRAAVVEAQCLSCLICLLSEFEDPESQKVAFAAGSALLQLMVGAMSRASVFSSDNDELNEAASPDKRDRVISDAVEKGAIDQFVNMARTTSRGKLRAMSVEALRVLSEDYHSSRRTRLQLCEVGAGGALGRVMKDDIEGSTAEGLARVMEVDHDHGGKLFLKNDDVVKELHQALCAWANILDRQESTTGPSALKRHSLTASTSFGSLSAESTMVKGCIQFAEAGGLESLLVMSALPFKRLSSITFTEDVDVPDLMVEICRSLASVSPLLLSTEAASQGYAAWSTLVLQALARILSSATDSDDNDNSDLVNELKFDSLRGIGALAKYKPHKMVIVDKYLPSLFQARTLRCDSFNVSGAAEQVFVSLGFVEDELAQQVAGNDPKLMGDWFCMKRSLLIQSMARAEIRKILFAVWKEPLRDLLIGRHAGQLSGVGRWSSKESNELRGLPLKASVRSGGEIRELEDIFDVLQWDQEGLEVRNTIIEQYHHVYEHQTSIAGIEPLPEGMGDWKLSERQSKSLMSSHVYPLDSTSTEKEWILSHRRFMLENAGDNMSIDVTSDMISERVQSLMDCCVPSRLIQQDVMPIFDLRPESSFDFRGFLMPQRRYFSFRREGQLVSRLCDMNAVFLPSDEVHWTLVFTNSTFAGEFSESLVQFLYRCPLIKGLTFARNANWRSIWSSNSEDEGQDTSGLLANLAGSLPPWVSCVVYDNTLSDFALTALVMILERMTTLSASQAKTVSSDAPTGDAEAVIGAQKQGSFRSFAVSNSPHLGPDAWKRFFTLLRRAPRPPSLSRVPPLASLRVLDLSGNELGDKLCSYVLKDALDKQSGCCLEQLDLSRNGIREGSRVVKVLRSYVSLYRFNQSAGVFVARGSWKSPLISLNLSSNELNKDGGGLALELIASLKNNAFSLKSLDLSFNGLEGEVCQLTELLLSSLVKNTCLRQLNLSGNRFCSPCIDGLLDRLNHSDSDSSLAFLQLENNRPPLTESQRKSLKSFANTSRTILLQRYLKNRDRPKTEDEDFVDASFTPSAEELLESGSFGPFSVSDTMSSVVDGTKRRPLLRRSSEEGKGENMITVLFSAPLVFHDDENRLRPFAKLDFDMERELIWQCLKEARRDIELFFDTAHSDRLLTAKTKRCSCLHYSGHGHPTHLPFENGKGMAHWLEVNVISDLIKQNEGAPFKFVFVSACHSGLVGETFARAGVPHVVCCQQESELKDSAALAFTRQFYLSLAVGQTVKESFEQGRKAVRATPNLRNAEEEMKKFVLLPKDGNHGVPVLDARPVREWPRTTSNASARSLQHSSFRGGSRPGRGLVRTPKSIYFGGARSSELSVRNMMQEDPSPTPPQFFTGREVDMYHVLNLILTQKLVNVVGEKGVGRSSLVYGLCHYVNERSSTIPMIKRIYFLKPMQNRSSDRFVAMLRGVLKKLMQDGRVPQQRDDDMDLETLIHAICKVLSNVKALLVIDRTDFSEGSAEAQDLVVFLRELFRETRTKHVRVLLIGRHPLGIPSIGGVVEQPYRLGPLTFGNTVHLFGTLCPHLHTPTERQMFCNRLVTDGSQSDLLPNDPATSERTQKLFDALGNGIPSRTETAAYTISSEELSRLEQI